MHTMATLSMLTFRVCPRLLLVSSLFLAVSACSPRLYTHPVPYGEGLRIEGKTVVLTFSKPWVLHCAAQAARHYQDKPQVQADIQQLAQRFAADTTQLVVVPVSPDTASLSPFLLFGYIDALLLRQRKFCAVDTRTGQYLPWVKFKWHGNSEDAMHGLSAPDGTVLYITTH